MLRQVNQIHDLGCFIGCIAILLNLTYEEAFQRVHPNRPMPPKDNYLREHQVGLEIEEALNLMPTLGLSIKKANLRQITSLRRRTSLVLLRWKEEPWQSHGVVFDGESGRFLDPGDMNLRVKDLQENLDSIYYVKESLSQRFD